jgi:hypothetical protein
MLQFLLQGQIFCLVTNFETWSLSLIIKNGGETKKYKRVKP